MSCCVGKSEKKRRNKSLVYNDGPLTIPAKSSIAAAAAVYIAVHIHAVAHALEIHLSDN